MMPTLFFYLFSTILLGSAACVVTARNPVHAVLFLILTFLNAAALFVLAGAEFLAMILVIVYVGAVAVLFMFVVMMLDVDFVQLREGFQRYAPVGGVVGLVLVAELFASVFGWEVSPHATVLGASATPANVGNTVALGEVIYTHYILLFQLSGLILLVSMVGAIVLTHRPTRAARRQNITRQQTRKVADTLEVLHVPTGANMKQMGIFRPKIAETLHGQPAQLEHEEH
jgi:NADH-quinone oxidoreductase subunit J